MKKFKKMLAGLLGAAMVLTSFGTPVWATGTKSPTISTDTGKTGSIIIHKYEYNGQDDLQNGTGQESDAEKVPKNVKKLSGVKFEAYKLADISQETVTDSDDKKSTALKYTHIIDGLNDNDFNEDTTYESIKDKITGTLTVAGTATTDEFGKATIDKLGLGVYLVKEVDAPSQVINKTANFIVSIPTTNTVTDSKSGTKYGDDWIYDVNVYPKNATSYGDVNLKKVGKIAGSDSETVLKGVKFILQQEVTETAATTTWETCKTGTIKGENDADVVNATGEYTTGADGVLSVGGLAPGKYRFIETDLASNDGYIMDGKNTYVFTISIDKNSTKKIELNHNEYAKLDDNTIIVTNEKPDMKKEVKRRDQEDGKDDWQHDADYSVGDMVPYRITIDVPSNIAQLKEFTLQDTPTNLKDDAESINITCDNTAIAHDAWEIDENSAPKNGFKINFVPGEMKAYAGKQIVVSYNAKLLKTAVTTTVGNPNTATLEYSNNILPNTDDTTNPNHDKTPGKDKIEDTAVVYTFSLNIHKTDASTSKTPLQGVEFDLYKEVPEPANGDTTNVITGKDASVLGLAAESYWLKINTDKLVTGKNGEIAQSGLSNGEYYLVETKTNKGFNLLKSPVRVVLDIEYTISWTVEKEWVDEKIDENTVVRKYVKHSKDKKKTTFIKGSKSTGDFATDTGIMTENIINRKGFTLPKTGDIGTAMFLIIGIGGMLAAVYIMLRGRKRA